MTEKQVRPHREQIAASIVNAGLFFNVALAAVKVTVGVVGHSRALLADGINSTSDVAYYIAVKIFTRMACKPADEEHPYGHHQLESIAAVVIGAFVITTAVAIFWDSISTAYDVFFKTEEAIKPVFGLFSLLTALSTIIIKIGLFVTTKAAAKTTKNVALLALAYDHRNDIFSASGAAIGITLGWLGFSWADPLAGACVALIVLRTGIHILQESSSELMDAVPGAELDRQIKDIANDVGGVALVEDVRTHRFGPYIVINITIGVEGALSVIEGDAIATKVETRLFDGIDLLKNVYVHYHPVEACKYNETVFREDSPGSSHLPL